MMTARFDDAYTRILAVTNCRTQVELADVLGIRQSSVSDAKKRGTVPAEWLLTILQRFSVNPDWILTGEGAQYLAPTDERPEYLDAVHKLAQIELLCTAFDRGRGIWWQIDENRQLLQILLNEFPAASTNKPFVEHLIAYKDIFLVCLLEITRLQPSLPSHFNYRPWPGTIENTEKHAKELALLIKNQINRLYKHHK